MPAIEPLGDRALLLRFGDLVDAAINRLVHACAAALRARPPPWLCDLTPAYASLALHVDTAAIASADPLAEARAWLCAWLQDRAFDMASVGARQIEIPVLYGGTCGPDLDAVAAHADTTVAEVIARHAAVDYTVAMLGFAPGFPYLLGLDPTLATPRHASPRAQVAAGSVGIGGAQTGIYPAPGPGGWQLIGRTPLRLFDAARDPPCLLQPGDRVRFLPIDAATFAACDEHPR